MAILTQPLGPRGAILPIVVGLTDLIASGRRKAGLPRIAPRVCEALLDTGAAWTLIDPAVLSDLEIRPSGEVDLGTASTSGERRICRTFVVQVTITASGKTTAATLNVVESDLRDLRVDALLGRDFLARCLLVYNGPSGEFTLSF